MRVTGSSVRVLLVDDHDVVVLGLQALLDHEEDIEVVATADTAAAAIDAAQELQPDVVVMDYGLPDTDGIEAGRQVRKISPQSKVVMLTGWADDSLVTEAVTSGCAGYVVKERAVPQLADAVRAAHAGEMLISPSVAGRLVRMAVGQERPQGSMLTARELQVLEQLKEGRSNQEIAEALVVSPHTVRTHIQSINTKLHARSRLEAVAIALKERIVRSP